MCAVHTASQSYRREVTTMPRKKVVPVQDAVNTSDVSAILPSALPIQPADTAPIINPPAHTTIHMEPLTIAEAVESVMAQFDCTAFEALDRLVTHGAISAEDAALHGMTLSTAPIINLPTITKETPMNDTSLPTMAESSALSESESPTIAVNAPVEPAATSYLDSTTPINVVVPRKDSPIKPYKVKRADHDRDVAYFDAVLRKRKDIARYVMPEYFSCPESWVPSVKLKQARLPPCG